MLKERLNVVAGRRSHKQISTGPYKFEGRLIIVMQDVESGRQAMKSCQYKHAVLEMWIVA